MPTLNAEHARAAEHVRAAMRNDVAADPMERRACESDDEDWYYDLNFNYHSECGL